MKSTTPTNFLDLPAINIKIKRSNPPSVGLIPPNGVIKINSDANLSKIGRWGLGVACRDVDGNFLAYATWELSGFKDPATA
ncbi:hypothetical protein TSUD_367820 [Trifolium subterraneum]|uniref:RNase H type-1 domain-containing protein n=1 Tax=Trifolium subterraneum TaxID=3900 RepID=A0A2Z6LIB7_TRISU|nr:hypothetical protein TSUD_367820 [Trifolium subterraneum]